MTDQNTASQLAIRSSGQDDAPVAVFSTVSGFRAALTMAKPLADSDLVPEAYRGKVQNVLVAMEMAQRTGAGIMAVMQNLHIISGRPSWSSSFIIAALNSCGRFSPIRFRVEDLGDKTVSYEAWEGPKGSRSKVSKSVKIRDRRWVAYCRDIATGDELEGPEVTVEMAVREGWYTKNDSKWPSMTDLMGRYRAAAFFGRLYAPDVLMGMHSEDEMSDIEAVREPLDITPRASNDNDPLAASLAKAKSQPEPRPATQRRKAEPKPKPEPEPTPVDDAEVIEAEPVQPAEIQQAAQSAVEPEVPAADDQDDDDFLSL